MIEFCRADEDGSYSGSYRDPLTPDVVRALGKAITTIKEGRHDAHTAHARVKGMYAWSDVAERTVEVYDTVLAAPHRDTYERLARYVLLLLLATLALCG